MRMLAYVFFLGAVAGCDWSELDDLIVRSRNDVESFAFDRDCYAIKPGETQTIMVQVLDSGESGVNGVSLAWRLAPDVVGVTATHEDRSASVTAESGLHMTGVARATVTVGEEVESTAFELIVGTTSDRLIWRSTRVEVNPDGVCASSQPQESL